MKSVLLIRMSVRMFLLGVFWILSEEPQCALGIYGFSLLVLQRSWPNVALPPVDKTAHSCSTLANTVGCLFLSI